MGWTVLYIAFGIVALWLLGEVLLQYKARLRWRMLAFAGFVVVVLGVLLSSVVVIGLGAITFAVGQTYVTLSFRRGFSTGWALGGNPGVSKRRKGVSRAPQEPTLQVSGLEYGGDADTGVDRPFDTTGASTAPEAPDAVSATDPIAEPASTSVFPAYEPQPMPDDTGQYGVYTQSAFAAPQPQDATETGGYSYPFPGQGGAQDVYAGGQDTGSYDTGAYHYGTGDQQQGYAAYSDPYIGTQSYPQSAYDTYGGHGQQYGTDTPPGGVWVPQQRDGEQPPAPFGPGDQSGGIPSEQPHPYRSDYDEQTNRY